MRASSFVQSCFATSSNITTTSLLFFYFYSLINTTRIHKNQTGICISYFFTPNSFDFTKSNQIIMSSSSKVIVLKSSDGDLFEVDEMVALEFKAIKDRVLVVIENGYDGNLFPLPNVSTSILSKVIEYCKKHVETPKTEDLQSFDADFVQVDQGTLFDLILV